MARILCPPNPDLVLPWWPTEIENTDWAAAYVETPRPGRTPLLTRSADPLPSLRMSFTIHAGNVNTPVTAWVDQIRDLSTALPVCQLMLGASDRGRWRITDVGVTELEWADDGEPSMVDVAMTLRAASDAVIPVGPIKKKPAKPKK
jgi:hypothetical protein